MAPEETEQQATERKVAQRRVAIALVIFIVALVCYTAWRTATVNDSAYPKFSATEHEEFQELYQRSQSSEENAARLKKFESAMEKHTPASPAPRDE